MALHEPLKPCYHFGKADFFSKIMCWFNYGSNGDTVRPISIYYPPRGQILCRGGKNTQLVLCLGLNVRLIA